MQKVQRWSQPFCTCTNARARPSSPSIRCGAVSVTAMMSLTTIFSSAAMPKSRGRSARGRDPRAALELLGVAEHAVDLGHARRRSPARSAPRSR